MRPLAAAHSRRLAQQTQAKRDAYRRKWAPVVAAFVAPFITPPKPPKPPVPKPHVFPPWVRITKRPVVTFVPENDRTVYRPLSWLVRDQAPEHRTHGYGTLERVAFPN